MSAYDTHEAARNPRVVAEVLARVWARGSGTRARLSFGLWDDLGVMGVHATQEQAAHLLYAQLMYDDARQEANPQQEFGRRLLGQRRERFDAALDAICGSES